MRSVIAHIVTIALFAAGLACACPAVAAEAEPHDMHSMHQMAGEHQMAVAVDCCEDCETAHLESTSNALPVAIDLRPYGDEQDDPGVRLPLAIDTDWYSRPPPDFVSPDATRFLPLPSPVTRKERSIE